MTSAGTSEFVFLLPHQEAGVVHHADVAELPLCGQYTSELASLQLSSSHLTAKLGSDVAVLAGSQTRHFGQQVILCMDP